MKQKVLCLFLAGIMAFAVSGCGKDPGTAGPDGPGQDIDYPVAPPESTDPTASADPVPEPAPAEPETPSGYEVYVEPAVMPQPGKPENPVSDCTDINPNWFEDELQRYIETEKGWDGKSYMASPASLKAALCLVIEGASGDTKDALLKASCFADEDGMRGWYSALLGRQMDFMERYDALKFESMQYGDGSDPGMGFDIANAIWDNADIPGGFSQDYIDNISSRYGATAASSPSDRITGDVNGWCSEKTHGMIQSISPDLSLKSSVLANALYVKSGWVDEFSEYMTEAGDFTKNDGSVVPADFMRQTEDFLYYQDASGRQYAMFGLEGGLWLTVCLDTDVLTQDFFGAMYNADPELLDVKMPKLDLETGFDSGEMLDFLDHMGGGLALGDMADFSAMTDAVAGWHIDDIIQKTRIKTDEKGLEAAAVTAIMMVDNAMVLEPEEPIEFYMDRPFSFLITAGRYSEDSGATVLFFGQYVG